MCVSLYWQEEQLSFHYISTLLDLALLRDLQQAQDSLPDGKLKLNITPAMVIKVTSAVGLRQSFTSSWGCYLQSKRQETSQQPF